MNPKSPLQDKILLVVDDEPDVIETVSEMLGICIIFKAYNYKEAVEHMKTYNFDVVILDIMGVNGFDLLKRAVDKGFPAVMLTAHALTPEAIKNSMKLGAVTFLPKEKMSELPQFLEEIVLGGGKPVWKRFFNQIGGYFDRRFGPDWKEKDRFLKEFEEAVKNAKS